MRWKLFANLAETAGDRKVELDLGAGSTIEDALEGLVAAHPELESELFDDGGELHDHVRILHDGTNPFAEEDGLDTAVEPDDELAVFPPVSGGNGPIRGESGL